MSDEDILAEFREENQMEVEDGDDGNEDEQQEETPKRPTKSEVRQAIETGRTFPRVTGGGWLVTGSG